ncbi:MAG: TolB family protein, partial [Anaerolineales bacterium]
MAPQIAVVSVADGSVRVLKTLDWGFPGKVWFSPDGRYIAYDYPPRQDSDNRDVFLLSAQGGREVPLVEHPADDLLLGWTPDGNHLLFASDRSGSMSAWMIRVQDGKPQGSPELVKPDIGQAVPLGFTRAGSYYYGLVIGTSDIYTAEFDPATGRVASEPQKATQRFTGSNFAPAWSPDGQFLAYRSSRPGPQVVIGFRAEVISIRSLRTGEERDLPPNLLESWGPIRWSLDGRSLFVTGKDRKLKHGVFRIDAQTGEVSPTLRPDAGSEIARPAWLPDGKR